MSTLKVTNLQHSSSSNAAITLASDGSVAVQTQTGMRNRLINGQFSIDQRNAGVDTVVADAAYGPDRWKMLGEDSLGKLKAKDTTVGGGRFNLALTCVTVNKKYGVIQFIEGINCKDLRGKTVILTANLSVSNTRLGNIKMGIIEWTSTEDSLTSDPISTWNGDGTTPTLATNFTFKNTPANLNVTTTPTAYSVTATLGTTFTNLAVFIWNDDQAYTASDIVYITDVQLETGSLATPFEMRPFGVELALCQRYFSKTFPLSIVPGDNRGTSGCILERTGTFSTSTALTARWQYPVAMRATPTITFYNVGTGTSGFWKDAFGANVVYDPGSPGVSDTSMYLASATTAGTVFTPAIHAVASAEL